jgi:pyruvate carboxylase
MIVAAVNPPAHVIEPHKDLAFPESVVQMLRGELGHPPGGWPEALQKKALKGAPPITVRPGSLLPPADLEAERAAAKAKTGADVDDRALAAYLMYPKVYVDFAKAHDTYGPVRVLPTPVFFYGLDVGEEIPVELEKGKTLIVRAQAIGETDDNGFRRVFFELNGQPRMVRIPDRAHGGTGAEARRKAEEGNPSHVAAPMPGVVSTLMVKAGQAVKAGDALLSIEAMKMETALRAERDGTIAEVLVGVGNQIDAKDLLVVYAS